MWLRGQWVPDQFSFSPRHLIHCHTPLFWIPFQFIALGFIEFLNSQQSIWAKVSLFSSNIFLSVFHLQFVFSIPLLFSLKKKNLLVLCIQSRVLKKNIFLGPVVVGSSEEEGARAFKLKALRKSPWYTTKFLMTRTCVSG